ncbi:MAG TPA: hypothetical protein VN176_11815 [Verrucomicrobiae bacterium]|jgi:hypothetical protein|nr:hypothetical protein [Verrucomicrobiae bacterium]
MNPALRFVTLSGVPIQIAELTWPFHPSGSGSDWLILHGRADLIDSTDGLHADVAVGMTQTMKESLGSADADHAEGLVINAIRKTIDNGQIAFMKSGKLQPAYITSRFYNFRSREIQFPSQSEEDARELIKRTVFWLGKQEAVEVARTYDCQYVNLPRQRMLQLAGDLAGQGLIQLDGDRATATDLLLKEDAAIQAAMHKGVEAGLAATKVSA